MSEGFLRASFGRAKHDALVVGEGIITAGIRLTGVLLPVALLVILPFSGLVWLLLRLWLGRQAASQSA